MEELKAVQTWLRDKVPVKAGVHKKIVGERK